MIKRHLAKKLRENQGNGKALFVIGPRQSGKTTLIRDVLLKDKKVLFYSGDDISDRSLLSKIDTQGLLSLLRDEKFLFVDEAQKIDNIGNTLKIIVDNKDLNHVQLYVSGSSSFEIRNKTEESLTGRKFVFNLFPVRWDEFLAYKLIRSSIEDEMKKRIIFGMYPVVVTNDIDAEKYLREVLNSYVIKDLFAAGGKKHPDKVLALLQVLAHQIGTTCSITSISNSIGLTRPTIENYIRVLVEGFIIFGLYPDTIGGKGNLRFSPKYYFYDQGILNTALEDFRAFDLRAPEVKERLFENFVVSEIRKGVKEYTKMTYWRDRRRREVDLVIRDGYTTRGVDIKLSANRTTTAGMEAFKQEVKPDSAQVCNRENFNSIVTLFSET